MADAGALAAMAQAGSAGLAAYNAAQQGMQNTRAQALSDAAARAQVVNMASTNPATQAVVASRIDPRIMGNAAARDTWGQLSAARQGAVSDFQAQTQAALPILQEIGRQKGLASATTAIDKLVKQSQLSDAQARVRLSGQAQLDQQAAVQGAQQRSDVAQTQIDSLRAQDEQLAKQQDAAYRAANGMPGAPGQGAGAPGATVFDPRTGTTHFVAGANPNNPAGTSAPQGTAQLGPAANRQAMIGVITDVARQRQDIQRQIDALTAQQQQAQGDAAKATSAQGYIDLARAAGARLGLDPARVAGLVGVTQGAAYGGAVNRLDQMSAPVDDRTIARDAGLDVSTLPALRQSPIYQRAAQTVQQLQGDPTATYESTLTMLQKAPWAQSNPRIVRLLTAEMKGLFPHAGALTSQYNYATNVAPALTSGG